MARGSGRRVSAVACLLISAAQTHASSHREAPGTAANPTIDGTDFYMFRSYEPGREGFVTIVANYIPLQDAYGGPNYFKFNQNAVYEINIDNNGDAQPDFVFEFRFTNTIRGLSLNVGGVMVPVALNNIGSIGPTALDNGNLNVLESYNVVLRRPNSSAFLRPVGAPGQFDYLKPGDNIGGKTFADYPTYAASHQSTIRLSGSQSGRVFVGQRKDPFVVNLGEVFDLVNTNPLGPEDGERDDLYDKNVTSIILELPISFLTRPGEPVIGGWTSASLATPIFVSPSGEYVPGRGTRQVSRLGMPLVNEVVIGLPDKDRFNASEPRNDGQFLTYVTNPTLPAILQSLFPAVTAPCLPRNDLVSIFLTGIPGLNQPANVRPSEMLRLNTAIAPTPAAMQSRLGVLGGDLAGFPNGRRPGDDVVDISLRAVMGAVVPNAGQAGSCAPSGNLAFTDGAFLDATRFAAAWPYLQPPIAGSPN
ncbi:MAG: DUF4331 domain-containing protein [Phycisphaerales bacterium]|nr:DUF4331 domain-containing protein [Phycisphaerales bacterium]